jgi:hypothetical protein
MPAWMRRCWSCTSASTSRPTPATRWCSPGRVASPPSWACPSSKPWWHCSAVTPGPASASRTICRPMACCLDDSWVTFLKRESFHVGLSIDGPRELHDRYRPTKGGTPSFAKVMRAARLLREADVPFAVLCVVNRDVARAPRGGLPIPGRRSRHLANPVHALRGAARIQTAGASADPSRAAAAVGQRAGATRPPAVHRDRLVGRPRRLWAVPVRGVGRMADTRLRPRACQPVRDRRGPVAGAAGAVVHLRPDLRQGPGAGARRQLLQLRPLRLPRVPPWATSGSSTRAIWPSLRSRCASASPRARACRPPAAPARSSRSAGASAPRTACCARPRASQG